MSWICLGGAACLLKPLTACEMREEGVGFLMDKEKIVNRIAEKFGALCKDLGLPARTIVNAHQWITYSFFHGKHAILLSFDWYDPYLDVFVLRLVDGKLPSDDVYMKYADGTWCRCPMSQIYDCIPPGYISVPVRERTDKVVERHYEKSADFYYDLIRNDPQRLLDFMGRIDDSPMNPPVE